MITDIDLYQDNLFLPADKMQENHLSAAVIQRLLRLRALYTYWLNFPQKSTREMVQQDMAMNQGICERMAYDDIKLVKILIGNLEQESKEWHRHVFNHRTDEVYRAAIRDHDWRSAEKANADYAKYNRIGEEDTMPIDPSEIIPHIIEPTDDPTVIGMKPMKNLRGEIRKMKHKLGADIQDADFIELDDEGNEKDLSE